MSRSNRSTRRTSRLALSAAVLGLAAAVAVPQAQQAPAAPAPTQGGTRPAAAGAAPAAPGQGPGAARPAAGAQGQAGAPAAAAAAPPQKPLVPVVASSLAAKPDAYYGENVTMMALVDQNLSAIAFAVDQDKAKSGDKDVLVLAPRLNEPLEPNTYVTVIGEAMKFDPANAKVKDRLTGLSPEVIARWTGKPVVVATSVVNSAMNDIARRLPPKMTTEEEVLQKAMQKVAAANGAMRTVTEKSDVEGAKKQAAELKAAFTQTEAFFRPYAKTDALGWIADARKAADAIDLAATAGKWDEVKAATANLGKTCGSCHTPYRDRFDDGSFRHKLGPLPPTPAKRGGQ